MIKIERKIYASVLTILLILVCFGSMFAVDLILTDTSDNIVTYVINSKGYIWDGTGANVETAITNASNGGWIKTPAGKLSISSDIDFNGIDNFTWISYGTELEVTDSTSFDGGGLISIYNCDNLHIEGLELDGNHPWNTSVSDSYAGINIRKCSNSTFTHLKIHNVLGDGIVISDGTGTPHFTEPSQHNIISYNYLHHIGDCYDETSNGDAGIRLMGNSNMSYNVIEGNHIDYTREHGIKIYGGQENDYYHESNKIINNIIEHANMGDWDKAGDPHGHGMEVTGEKNIVSGNTVYINSLMDHGIVTGLDNIVTDNTFIFIENSWDTSYGIYVAKTGTGGNAKTTVTDNIVEGNGYTNSGGIAITGDVTNVLCTGNKVQNVGLIGIYLQNGLYCDVSHNFINNTGSDGMNVNNDYNKVAYNTIRDAGDDGISITDINYCDVSHNIIIGAADDGINLYGTCVVNTISFNKIIDPINDGISFLAGSSFQNFDISHNHVKNNWNWALRLASVGNSTIAFNHLTNINAEGIQEDSDCYYNIFIGNNAKGSAAPWDMNGINSVYSTNLPTVT